MNFSPGKCYKDLLLEYLSMVIGDLSYLPGFENYHLEYLKDFPIEELEKVVRKFSKRGHTYFSFMVGVTWANCMHTWEKEVKKLSEADAEDFVVYSQSALDSLMSLLGVEDLSSDDMAEFVEELIENDGVSDYDDIDDEEDEDDFDEDDDMLG